MNIDAAVLRYIEKLLLKYLAVCGNHYNIRLKLSYMCDKLCVRCLLRLQYLAYAKLKSLTLDLCGLKLAVTSHRLIRLAYHRCYLIACFINRFKI